MNLDNIQIAFIFYFATSTCTCTCTWLDTKKYFLHVHMAGWIITVYVTTHFINITQWNPSNQDTLK